MWALLVALSCTSDPTADTDPSDVTIAEPTTVRSDWTVTLTPTAADGAWDLAVTAPDPVDLEVTFVDGEDVRTLVFPERHATRTLPLVGFRAGVTTTLLFSATSAAGDRWTFGPTSVEVPSPPDDFPLIEVLALDTTRTEPGLTLVDLAPSSNTEQTWAVLFDEQWRPTWWWHHPTGIFQDLELHQDGTLTGFTLRDASAVVADLGGRILETLGPAELADVTKIHHELVWLEDGGLVVLDETGVTVPAFPVSYDEPAVLAGPTAIADNVVRFFDAARLPTMSWSMAERLDTTRIGFDSLRPTDVGSDWLHANALTAAGDGWLLSSRHQDCLVKLDSAGEVVWIFGTPSGWTAPYDALLLQPVGEVSWPFHQHGPHMVGERITVFDNREEQRTPYDDEPAPPPWSRVVVYEVDEAARTVTQIREHAETAVGTLDSHQIGDADPLPLTDGILATYGYVLGESGMTNLERGWGEVTTHLVEFAPDGDVVSHVRFRSDGAPPMELGIRAYRAERIPSAYPTSGPAAATWQVTQMRAR